MRLSLPYIYACSKTGAGANRKHHIILLGITYMSFMQIVNMPVYPHALPGLSCTWLNVDNHAYPHSQAHSSKLSVGRALEQG